MKPVVIVGDVLLDRDIEGRVERLSPDGPAPVVEDLSTRSRPGGAGLAAALLAASGRPATLIAAFADDSGGQELRVLLKRSGVEVVAVPTDGETPEKVRVRGGGHPLLRLDRGRLGRPGPVPPEAEEALMGAGAVLVSDYGGGIAASKEIRRALEKARAPLVWDPHPRGPAPVAGAHLVTPNHAEVAALDGGSDKPSGDLARVTEQARALARTWKAQAVAVTMGRRGALVVWGQGAPLAVPPPAVAAGDPCGAGDCFASTAAARLAGGAVVTEAVTAAVAAASAFVAAGGAASWNPAPALAAHRPDRTGPQQAAGGGRESAFRLATQVRAAGGTVVATGGCFDLLHAGHVALLQAARRLGDCLVVCLNSDRSVRDLKGPERPIVGQADRAAVLEALDCVDAVVTFDEATPETVLDQLRPHVFAKGGDYAGATLPEADALRRWGGQVVVLPYLEGRSTTRLLEEVKAHA